VKIMTLAEGEISELHVGLKGTMNALFLKDLAKKTHRGIRGRVEKGKAGGGLCYGYDVVKRLDTEGEPVCGERTINQAEAAVVRRVFRDFGNGISPRTIAQRLNADRIPGPGGKLWSPTTLRGHAKRGTGFLNNALYVGKLVWNRQRYVKDPSTGKRVSRINPESAWITTDVPELRIVDDALWQEAKARQDSISIQYAAAIAGLRSANRLNRTHRPKSLLSGLLFCGCCGGSFSLRGQGRFACSTHIDNNSCSNSRTISRDLIEARVLDGLRDKLMAPEIAAEAVRAYVEETNRLNHQRRAVGAADKTELAKIVKAIDGLVEIAMEGRHAGTDRQAPGARSARGCDPSADRRGPDRRARHSPQHRRDLSPEGRAAVGGAKSAGGARRGGRCNPGSNRTGHANARAEAWRSGRDAARRVRRDFGLGRRARGEGVQTRQNPLGGSLGGFVGFVGCGDRI
jgi:site-specific DNA recombinase